jgi:hypothetical protein
MYECALNEIEELLGSPLDRRRFLKGSVGGVALLGLGSLLPAGCTSYPKPPPSMLFFTAKEYAVVNQVAVRVLGAYGEVGGEDGQIDVASRLDGWLAGWDAEAKQQIRLLLRVFEHGTYLFDLQRRRFTKLSEDAQDRYLAGWMNSTLGARRIVFRALKALAAAGFYGDQRAWDVLGYEGPWLGRVEAAAIVEHQVPAVLGKLGGRP